MVLEGGAATGRHWVLGGIGEGWRPVGGWDGGGAGRREALVVSGGRRWW
uniref:Uncharacterized protein n=1 Tax=Arundo donax TaxID=35708 RepID=A0A0A9GX94_ARUDO